MLKTIEEIKDDILEMCCGDEEEAERLFNNCWDETCKHLNEYKDDDEFYTNGDVYYPKAYAEAEMYEHTKALAYIEDRGLLPDLQEYGEQHIFETLWNGWSYPQEKFEELVKDFVFEDFGDYIEWYLDNERNKDDE